MGTEQIQEDIRFLSAELLHRSALSEEEHRAAAFLRNRFRCYTPDVAVEPFHTIENHLYLFGMYYGEFLVVAFIAAWWPRVALIYGSLVLIAYLAEFLGYRVLGRFLPQFESQNVMARFLGVRPRYQVVVTAYYDSGRASPLTDPWLLPFLQPIHIFLLCCMAGIVTISAVEAVGILTPEMLAWMVYLRWAAAGVLGVAALAMLYASTQGDDTRGANSNASGVAALLDLAARISAEPVEEADVLLVATGSHANWMAGVRHLLDTHSFDTPHAFVLNLENVGAGRLHYITAEGMVSLSRAPRELVRAAEAAAPAFAATPGRLRGVAGEAHPVHGRGIPAMSIMRLGESGYPL
ncbi:MAG: M28 family peptidase, partial [Candidatus Hydrogenedentes bacterium]|nr:M28 family peptidase [Candidatus Hydrogenedentota bacterium]